MIQRRKTFTDATLMFTVTEPTGYHKTNYSVPFTCQNLTIDKCVEELLRQHGELTGMVYQEVSEYAITPTYIEVKYVVSSQVNDDYYNNFRDKPREYVGHIRLS